MKATKKPKRPNPFRSNLGFINAYENRLGKTRLGDPLPRRIGTVYVNSSGHQRTGTRQPFLIPPQRSWR